MGAINPFQGHDRPEWRGLPPTGMSWHAMAAKEGYPGGWVHRLDSRQELTLPLTLGPVNLTPWVMARATFWDDRMEGFAGNEHNWRGLVGTGVRANTKLVGTDSDIPPPPCWG